MIRPMLFCDRVPAVVADCCLLLQAPPALPPDVSAQLLRACDRAAGHQQQWSRLLSLYSTGTTSKQVCHPVLYLHLWRRACQSDTTPWPVV